MAFIPIGSAVVNVPARTEDGELKGARFPAGDNEVILKPGEVAFKIQPGEQRHDRVDAANRISNERLRRLQSAIAVASYVGHGMPVGGLYNAGPANNPTEQITVEVLSVAGNVLTVRGPNPARLQFGISRVNPEWPAPDEPRIIFDPVETSLPLPAMVEFLSPSVLAHKIRPWVRKVVPPASDTLEDVTFDLELSCSVSAARVAFDAARPPADGKYWARIHFWGVLMPAWANWQDDEEMQVEWVEEVFDTDPLPAELELSNSEGDPGRVLYPGSAPFIATFGKGGVESIVPGIASRLSSERTISGWQVKLDVGDLEADSVSLGYWIEASVLGGDPPPLDGVVSCSGSCTRSQRQGGGFEHDDGFRCTNQSCSAFLSGDYERVCWHPDADGFTLAFAPGPGPARADARRSGNVSRLWSRRHVYLEQGLPGVSDHRNFRWVLASGPSVQELVGGLPEEPGYFVGRFALREGLAAVWGVHQTFTNPSDGDTDHRIVHGLFRRRDGNIGPATGWFGTRANHRGGSTTDDFPLMGPPPSGVYSHGSGTDGFPRRSRYDAADVSFLAEVPNVPDSPLDQTIRDMAE